MNALGESRPRVRRRRHFGFTLVELLVAAGLTVLIAAVLLGLLGTTLDDWDATAGTLSAEDEARNALDRLEQDLNGACHRDDGSVWLAATIQPDASGSGVWVNGSKPVTGSLDITAADLRNARFGLAGVWLRFVTSAQIVNNRDGTSPVAVSYQVVRRPPTLSGSAAHYLLYRSEVTAATTLAVGYDLSATPYNVANDAAGDPGNLVRPALRQVLADNVIDFGVRLFAYLPDPATGVTALQQIFPVGAADLEYRAQSPRAPTETSHPFPAVVDVLIRVLTPKGSRLLSALEAGRMGGDWWGIAAAHSKVLVRRISVKSCQP